MRTKREKVTIASLQRENKRLLVIIHGMTREKGERAESAQRVAAALRGIIDAWGKVQGGRVYTIAEIENWLLNDMRPAIRKARQTTGQTRPGSTYTMEVIQNIVRWT